MILIIGGAYQGKLEFAKEIFGITDGDVHTCTAGEIDFSKRCIYKIEEFTYGRPDPIGYFKAHREQWQDSILILQDIFCGVVPMGAETRAWRQNTGRLAQYLSKEATQVSRIFCGLEQRLK
ncbi:MAG: bifunctional adenosylcobinamide kinase/adenosylcobinamide-phosphate guanylyltransferase [Oscillospiraceae bacterium]|nr:bifunctional adenosylcobinamide kinase/adenosylcobinamide-phosphate guanylyltransferase [Oscillospiraceae bacterium]